MGSVIGALTGANAAKKAARQQAEAERIAKLEDVTVTAQGEDVPTSTTEADHDTAEATQNRKARRASISKTVNDTSVTGAGGVVSGRKTLGGS